MISQIMGGSEKQGAQKSIQLHLVIGLAIIVVLAGGLGGWASTAEISGALIAPGQIVVESNVKKVQHPTGGVVGEVLARDGDLVKAGQAQRVALARALYGNPFLIVLDEPNSNLDTEGDEALTRAVRAARERGAIVVVVAHRPIGIEGVDQLLVLKDGRVQAFGPKETVLGQVLQRVAPPTPIKIVSEGGVSKS